MARQSERSETERQENFPSLVASTNWRSRSTGADQRPFSSQLLKEMPLLLTPSLTFGVQNCWRRCGVDSLLGVAGSSSLSGVNERYGLWVLKNSLNRTAFHLRACRRGFLSPFD